MALDPSLAVEVRGWFSKAGKDLATAEYELQAEPPFAEDILFHSQQAVEKSLKGFLSWHGIPFRKTHNLIELGEVCCQVDRSLEPLLRRAAPLTEYAWKFRYPGDDEDPSPEEAGSALNSAGGIRTIFEERQEMQISYDEEADALYIRLLEGEFQCRTVRMTSDIALDFAAGEKIVGIEVLGASHLFKNPEAPQVELRHLVPQVAA